MEIVFHKESKIFHLFNQSISYIIAVLPDGHIGQLYFGGRIHDRADFSYLLELAPRDMASYPFTGDRTFSRGHVKQEYAVYGSGDYRYPAVSVLQENGSRLSDFCYESYEIISGKPELRGLPATYSESDSDAETLVLKLYDTLTGVRVFLSYTIFSQFGALARSVRLVNEGSVSVYIERAMSVCLDLPDHDYDWIQFSGAWARERTAYTRKLEFGIQAVNSTRGHSSHEHNPFIILKRPVTDEFHGEAIGFSLVYSGNFLAQAEVESHGTTRFLMGIEPFNFQWKLEPGEEFQTPECVVVYTSEGLNKMSQSFHRLYQTHLIRGYWRDRPRPILINNWEATYFDFTEEKLLRIAGKAKECGIELFVLDDGWFGSRCSSRSGLGDWYANRERLPDGIKGLAEKMENLGMRFGLWFEPEMVNEDSELYRAHPDWILHTPGRSCCHGRYQYVLDFARPEVVDYIYDRMYQLLKDSHISYIKWDMNRSITECYSIEFPPDRQGEIFHRYILGVYNLYERLISAFPHILFESCASGGARFDAGLLYYAPQGWASDNTDAVCRLGIQYGTSYCYPISSIGNHVSASPNHQLGRSTPLWTRANVAYFGTFGYELDLEKISEEEKEIIRKQVAFMKKHRSLLQFGLFYRLKSPFEGNVTAWMTVSDDGREALVGWYRVLNEANGPFTRLRLAGLNAEQYYEICDVMPSDSYFGPSGQYGDELMNMGLITSDSSCGQFSDGRRQSCDFDSRIFYLKACPERMKDSTC